MQSLSNYRHACDGHSTAGASAFYHFSKVKGGLDYRVRPHRRWRFDTSDGSTILELDSDREIVAIDVERDVDILWVQLPTGRIMKAPDFSTCQDEATNVVSITRSTFQTVPEVDCAEFILVSSVDAIVAHRDEANLIGRPRENGADGRLCRDQRGRVKLCTARFLAATMPCVPALVR
jgi:hypothetical protein